MDTSEKYEMEKTVWTDADFDIMGWHDSTIWAMAVISDEFEFSFDIDYILRWVHPVPPEQAFGFWVSPATLVFQDVQNLKVEIEADSIFYIEVADINREGPFAWPDGTLTKWKWVIELQQGRIEFEASGFTQYFRQPPVFGTQQGLGLDQRGGISFDRQYAG
ncbi:MAG: hypothetical protein AB7J13_02670 [Pyrinomonadaceae bacterium]